MDESDVCASKLPSTPFVSRESPQAAIAHAQLIHPMPDKYAIDRERLRGATLAEGSFIQPCSHRKEAPAIVDARFSPPFSHLGRRLTGCLPIPVGLRALAAGAAVSLLPTRVVVTTFSVWLTDTNADRFAMVSS